MPLYLVFYEACSFSFVVVGADHLPHIRRWLRMKRRFYVTVTYQGTTTKLASAKFDGQTARWNKKLDTLCEIPFVILIF
jgi:hypothetical protein